MERKGYYLIAYDISDPGRLSKVHRIAKQECISMQRSVFFITGCESDIGRLLDRLNDVIKGNEDDIRAYPISHPGQLWTSGFNPLAGIYVKTEAPIKKFFKKKWFSRSKKTKRR